MNDIYDFHPGGSPLLISIPHAGTELPAEIGERLTPAGRELPDTDWYVDRLYAFARELGASVITANYSRYVVDLNRAPDSSSLYTSNPTSPVCASRTFDDDAIYRDGEEPTPDEVARRIERYWRPYHDRIGQELHTLRERHGVALLWDAHSIASEVPGLFAGVLPEFNLGTRDGVACPAHIADALQTLVLAERRYSAVVNGRFKGGYITLHYGRPAEHMYAVQLELAQRVYMKESPRGSWEPAIAADAVGVLRRLLGTYVTLADSG